MGWWEAGDANISYYLTYYMTPCCTKRCVALPHTFMLNEGVLLYQTVNVVYVFVCVLE